MPSEQEMFLSDPIPTGWRICTICGAEGYDVRPSLAWLKVPGPDGPVQSVTRCKAAGACRERCVSQGDDWPIDDERQR